MLHELVEYARRQGIDAEAGFVPKTIRWLIIFNERGRFLNVQDLADPNEKKSRGREYPKVPHLKFSGDTPMRQFLVDSAQYFLLYEQKTPDKKLLTKHNYALDLLRAAGSADSVFNQIADALADDEIREAICTKLSEQGGKPKPTDNVTFAVSSGEDVRILVEEDTWHDWWRSHFPTLFKKKDATPEMCCLLTGQVSEPVLTHPKIKGLAGVGGNVETTLVGFNKDSFCSYGLSQSANAAICDNAAQQYAAALNTLLDRKAITLAGTKIAYWYSRELPPEDDPFQTLRTGLGFRDTEEVDEDEDDASPDDRSIAQSEDRVRYLLEAIRAGERPDLVDCMFKSITLSGNAGRVVIRDWLEGRFEELAENVEAWFDHLSIINRYGDGLAKRPKFAAVLGAMVRDLGDVPAPLVAKMWRVAVTGQSIPYEAMARALARVRVDIIQDNPFNHARMGLLKAFCITNGDTNMKSALNPDHPEPAYHCGRLLAVLAYIQFKALGDVGAGVVQRYFAAASSTPALVLGRLVRTAQFHLDKISEGPVRGGLEKRLAEIWNCVRDNVPSTLTLEQQTLFAMGYYHQKSYRGPQEEEAETISAEEA